MPPTLNLVDPDEHAGALDLTPLRARQRELHVALLERLRLRWPERRPRPATLGRLMAERQAVADLVAMVDRLEGLLERSGPVRARGRERRRHGHPAHPRGARCRRRSPPARASRSRPSTCAASEERPPAPRAAHAIVAPLTGVYYRSPSPGAEPYVREGGPVNAGQVIGLIEAMKLFNEIKSDVTGTVRHIAAGGR